MDTQKLGVTSPFVMSYKKTCHYYKAFTAVQHSSFPPVTEGVAKDLKVHGERHQMQSPPWLPLSGGFSAVTASVPFP